ncbi:PAS domain protein [Pseudovibrio sp. Ad26]|nr:PAS domain protein [Pseudovibrio sp. Ad26]
MGIPNKRTGEGGNMKHGASRILFEYWDEIRAERPAPERGDIQPSAIKSVLGDTFILELAQQNNFRFRLAGTRLCSLFCRELKGRSFLDGWDEKDQQAVTAMLSAITQDGAAAVISFTGTTEMGQSVDLELLLLPIRVQGEGCTRILGCMAPLKRPFWLGVQAISKQKVNSLRLIWPDEDAPLFSDENDCVPHFGTPSHRAVSSMEPRVSRGTNLARSATPKAVEIPNSRQVGHLRVVDGGKI